MTRPAEVRLSFCADLVRRQAPDRYLATLFAPACAREALFALYAFDHEIGKVRHIVSQPMAGLIRLQWWREALDALEAGLPPAHPVALALAAALRGSGLPRHRLDRAIDAREGELEDELPPDLAALEQRLEASSSTITEAAMAILGATAPGPLEVARRVGIAVGLADLLRALESDLAGRRLLLPADALARHGVQPEAIVGGENRRCLLPVVAVVAGRARKLLREARRQRAAVPRPALAAVLPGTLAGGYLRRLRRAGDDPFAAGPKRRPASAPLELLWYRAVGRF
jgi:NADH dehydrogenase [ubiquinone] 1 alpha subcomplex assembly factor 6